MARRDVINKLQNMTHLAWDEKAVTSGTGGTFLKSRTKTSRKIVYYKLSCYDRYRGIYGHESVNELLASRILERLCIPHIPYRLIHAMVIVNGKEHETWLSESCDYRAAHERRLALDRYIEQNALGDETPLEFCARKGWSDDVNAMMAFDYLIINRDRHGANVEVVLSDGDVKLAPLFDHGVSLAFSCYDDCDRIARFDAMDDYQAQNYLASRSLEYNLQLIPKGTLRGCIIGDGQDWLFHGLKDAMPVELRDKVWEIVETRWQHLLDLGIAEEIEFR